MSRVREIVVALGAAGMGKTFLTRQLVDRYPGDVRVLDPGGAFEFGEWPGRKGTEEWISELTADGEGPAGGGWGPGLLVLDDADRYLAAHSMDAWRDVWLANRHLQLDVMVNAHRPQGLPKDLLGCTRELWLFAQEEPRALEYLASVPSLAPIFREAREPLPTKAGEALRVRVFDRSIKRIKLF